jgi:hypothetical protein
VVSHLLGDFRGIVAETVAELKELAATRRKLFEEIVEVPEQLAEWSPTSGSSRSGPLG